jgi:sec-independent protein translocase protein TatB
VSDVKAEVNRSMELDELRKMKDTVENAARDVESSIQTTSAELGSGLGDTPAIDYSAPLEVPTVTPEYKHPGKKWRIKQGAVPNWFKARSGVRRHALSGAARVARYRPKKFN